MHIKSAATQAVASHSAVLLIGSGRMANHLKYWNSLLAQPNKLLCWDRSQHTEILQNYLRECSRVWLAIADSAIVPFFEEYLYTGKHTTVHFSGAPADERLLCAHPLMSFPKDLLRDEVYSKIHFVINGFNDLTEALPGFTNKFSYLSSDKKSLYHALCVLAGNFPQMLWSEVSTQMQHLNLPPEALDLYIRQITENYLRSKEKALTGPLIRKDYVTIEKNISSLDSSVKLKNIYVSFTKEFGT